MYNHFGETVLERVLFKITSNNDEIIFISSEDRMFFLINYSKDIYNIQIRVTEVYPLELGKSFFKIYKIVK
jgi:hypothetical protein